MTRYWVSWISGNYADEGCTKPPFKFWSSGTIDRINYGLTAEEVALYESIEAEVNRKKFLNEKSRDDCTLCAVIDSENEAEVWGLIKKHYPDFKPRFCDQKSSDFIPGERFQ